MKRLREPTSLPGNATVSRFAEIPLAGMYERDEEVSVAFSYRGSEMVHISLARMSMKC